MAKKYKSRHTVYIILDGIEYRVNEKNDAINALIDATDTVMTPKNERLRTLDIKGLGLLRYDSRKIVRRRDKRKGLEYRLKFHSVDSV